MKVALVVYRSEFEQDRIFEFDSRRDTSGALTRWRLLREYLDKRGVELHTHDIYSSLREPDALILEDPPKATIVGLVRGFVNPRKVVVNLNEPPVIRRWTWKYLKLYSLLTSRALVSNKAFVNGGRIRWLPLPQPFDGYGLDETHRFREVPKQGFMAMLRGNKVSEQPGELYSERRRLVQYFNDRDDDLLDLYGPGWNDPNQLLPVYYKNYQGYAPGTVETFAKYKFVLGMDNSAIPGLLTYDLFSAFFVGSVPVYLGAPDITDYVPKDCFVDYRDFESLDALVDRLQHIASSDELEAYRRRGEAVLESPEFAPFTMEHFCETVFEALYAVARR